MANSEQRDKLKEYLLKQQQRRAKLDTPEYQDSVARSANMAAEGESRNALVAALMDSASMMGSLGGKRADASPVSRMGEQLNRANEGYRNRMAAEDEAREKRYGVDAKIYEHLAEKEQKAEDTASTNEYRAKLLEQKKETSEDERKRKAAEAAVNQANKDRDYELRKNIAEKSSGAPDKASGKIAESFESDYAKKTQIASVIDAELDKFNSYVEAGDEDAAVRQGEGMLKALNSAFGPDAVGVEESKTLGGFLKKFKEPWAPGSTFGRDLDMFSQQVKGKSEALKQAAGDSLARAKRARSQGMDGLADVPARSNTGVNPTPKAGEAIADTGYVTMRNPKTGEKLKVLKDDVAEAETEGFTVAE
jgi:hypothetical protein